MASSARARGTRVAGVVSPASADTLFDGQVRLWQPARGYRVNVDSLLLAHFAASLRPSAKHVVDLGSGVGAVTLAYSHWASVVTADLVEREPDLLALAQKNLVANAVNGTAHLANLQDGLPSPLRGTADVVLSNPPYFESDETNALPRARARHGGIQAFLVAASESMGRRARAFFVYPAGALPELFSAARAVQLVPKSLQLVHPYANAPARIALVELRRAKPGGLVIVAPVCEWARPGVRSDSMLRVTSGAR